MSPFIVALLIWAVVLIYLLRIRRQITKAVDAWCLGWTTHREFKALKRKQYLRYLEAERVRESILLAHHETGCTLDAPWAAAEMKKHGSPTDQITDTVDSNRDP